MLTIGLTGGIACGKSTIAAKLAALGAPVIDADKISHELTAPGGAALAGIRSAFGEGVFHPDGSLNRAALGQLVFSDAEALNRLNAITHPLIRQEMDKQREVCRKAGAPVVVLDVPLLFEAGMQDMADTTVCAAACEETQITRLLSRDGLSRNDALRRIRSQMPVALKAMRCDIVVDTDRPLEAVLAQVETLYRGWRDAARKENA